MELEKDNNINISNNNEIVNENDQKTFLETSIGKIVDSALDVGLRMILPDFVEDGVLEVKDSLIKGGLKEGVNTAVDGAIDLGKSIIGIFTGDFDNISQARDAVKSGGIIDGISEVLDKVIDKTNSEGLINSSIADLISNGKDSILDNISNNIEEEFTKQIDSVDKLSDYENNWKEAFEEKNFDKMQDAFDKIKNELDNILPMENTIKEARVIENLHTLIQNNGKDFNLTKEQLELANMLT